MTGAFYQTYWDMVSEDLLKKIQDFMLSCSFDGRINETHICLLPKKVNSQKLSDYRPISLCNFMYKVVSKILSSRLKIVLPELISETQAAFIKGRLISDNILLAHELLHALRTKDEVSSEYIAMKTDMMKAFDRLEWSFVETTMQLMGFREEWIKRIMCCLTSVTYRVLINGKPHGVITPSRRIRQGDPLSPFLFILSAEVLSNAFKVAEDEGRITGLKVAATAPTYLTSLIHRR